MKSGVGVGRDVPPFQSSGKFSPVGSPFRTTLWWARAVVKRPADRVCSLKERAGIGADIAGYCRKGLFRGPDGVGVRSRLSNLVMLNLFQHPWTDL